MRTLVLSAVAATFLLITQSASAGQRYCTGSCDDYVTDDSYRDDGQLSYRGDYGDTYEDDNPDYYDEPDYVDRFAGRTEFCRETSEKRGHGWFKKRVNVRRCIWVRNDLVPNHADRGDGWTARGRYSRY